MDHDAHRAPGGAERQPGDLPDPADRSGPADPLDRVVRPPRGWPVPVVAVGAVAAVAALGVLVAVARDGASEATAGLSLAAATVLGLVEGVTEYLPVSSTGHLLVAQRLLGLGGDANDDALDTYAICIQAGAILAVLLLYRGRVLQMLEGLRGRDPDGRRALVAVLAAFVPTVVIAVGLEGVVRDRLFGPGPVAAAWLVGGAFILWMSRSPWSRGGSLRLVDLTMRQAVVIGLCQSLALWPGVSRSLVTIAAGLALGLTLAAAVEFSFLLGLLTLTAATAYEGLKNGSELVDTFGIGAPVLGLVVAFVSALVAVRWMVAWLERRGLEVFGWYRIVIGVAALVAIAVDAL
jgi:undecaprenyl-diphosphatase